MSVLECNVSWNNFISILKQEVKPALGCTEPVSLALACATAVSYFPGEIDRIEAWVSPNLMKNGMGVTVPGTGMKGLSIAAALGAIAGDANAGLEVLKKVTHENINSAKELLLQSKVNIMLQAPCDEILYVKARVSSGVQHATVTISGDHTNITSIEKNNSSISIPAQQKLSSRPHQVSELLSNTTLKQIYTFAVQVPLSDIKFILNAARMNNTLSCLGLTSEWGLHIGSTLRKQVDKGYLSNDLTSQIIFRTSSASDARMGGATLPAMTNSGSGNQGITATMPVVVVAEHISATDEMLSRALTLSHLVAIYIHNQLPKLSALCATTTAAMGAAAGMLWLLNGNFETISMAIKSMIGDVSGMICDGASNSCAMKVSTSVSSAWKASLMALEHSGVSGHDGIVSDDVENTISNLCALASKSMQHTDQQIIQIMMNKAV